MKIRLRPDWVRLMRNLCSSWPANLLDWGGFASLVCPSRLTATIRIVSSPPCLLPGPACLPACPPACLTSATDNLAWGGLGRQGWWGVLSWRVGARVVDQETRTVHRGTLFGEVQPPPPPPPPPPSEYGGTCRVSSQLLLAPANRGGCLTCTCFHYSASRIPYGPS